MSFSNCGNILRETKKNGRVFSAVLLLLLYCASFPPFVSHSGDTSPFLTVPACHQHLDDENQKNNTSVKIGLQTSELKKKKVKLPVLVNLLSYLRRASYTRENEYFLNIGDEKRTRIISKIELYLYHFFFCVFPLYWDGAF